VRHAIRCNHQIVPHIDLNADLGEHDGNGFARDEGILDVVTSASIACGAHAGNLEVMRRTIAMAYERGVSIGAHPSYDDREGFGRRELNLAPHSIIPSVIAQLDFIEEACSAEGATLSYIKPHGALYNRAAKDRELARALSAAFARFDARIVVLALSGSVLASEADLHGLRVASEAFIDRAYMGDGSLAPRDMKDSVIEDADRAASRAVRMASERSVLAIDGTEVALKADSFCVHGDSANALKTIRLSREKLEAAGFTIAPFA
jgi:UPF0271 protein